MLFVTKVVRPSPLKASQIQLGQENSNFWLVQTRLKFIFYNSGLWKCIFLIVFSVFADLNLGGGGRRVASDVPEQFWNATVSINTVPILTCIKFFSAYCFALFFPTAFLRVTSHCPILKSIIFISTEKSLIWCTGTSSTLPESSSVKNE